MSVSTGSAIRNDTTSDPLSATLGSGTYNIDGPDEDSGNDGNILSFLGGVVDGIFTLTNIKTLNVPIGQADTSAGDGGDTAGGSSQIGTGGGGTNGNDGGAS
jgi:hypothetical protein